MPNLEAPTGFDESSPDNSYSAEFGVGALPVVDGVAGRNTTPTAAIQIRVHTPEPLVASPMQQRLPTLSPHALRVRPLPRISSYDRDIAELEEENHWPIPIVQLLPVNLPPQLPEPPLDELLRRVTGRTDLQNVETVRLRVISYSISLSRLPLFLPRLQHLDLSGSVLCSLRDLGYGLMHLNHLNVSNCGLNSFDGTSGLPAVRVLIADGNMIQRVDPLTELPLLQHLSVQNNRISDLGLITFLGLCPNLMELELQGNPVCHMPLYRTMLQRSVPTLHLLDGVPIRVANGAAATQATVTIVHGTANSSTDGEVSSLSSDLYSDISQTDSMSSTSLANGTASPTLDTCQHRLLAAPNENNDVASEPEYLSQQLPHSASASSVTAARRASLSMGAPVFGSVLSLARRQRPANQQQRRRQAWGTSQSSSATSSNSSTRPPSPHNSFELKLPSLQTQRSHESTD